MDSEYLRNNLRFLATALALISAMATCFLLLSERIGGADYFRNVLQGETLLPVLTGLIAAGAVAAYFLRDKQGDKRLSLSEIRA